MTAIQTNWVQFWWIAFYLRDLEWCGVDPCGSMAAIRYFKTSGAESQRMLEGISLSSWGGDLDTFVQNGPSFAMDVHQDPRKQLHWLRQIEPEYLMSYPSNLEFLAGLIQEEGKPIPRLRVIQAIAETLTEEARTRIESGFGVPVKNTYEFRTRQAISRPRVRKDTACMCMLRTSCSKCWTTPASRASRVRPAESS